MSMASRIGARTVITRPHQQDAGMLRLASTPKSVQSKSGLLVHASYSASELSPRFSTRPYTVREGDTLFQIAKKRGISIDQMKALNARLDLNTELLHPGDTILLPAGKLSERDLQILSGIGKGSNMRIYSVRKGENIESIASNRGIPLSEVEKLNPDTNLSKLVGGENLLLPAGFYTKREKEVLSQVMPETALMTPKEGKSAILIPAAIIVMLLGLGITAASSKRFKRKLKKLMKSASQEE
uniref:LysM domain-containing protein n=1 Tax=Pyramimonas obovata TaxID=1411642 RepID=A0A7S0WQV1_9CHLO|eukprot:CAMPEP_0118928458 /NCGR_PEP_ID=MMETSP1169-20130426/5699_1 /TAXON_ID=36882 /ORGANISM="Pyramimonas obovata, Strain CCMP722" /LENGTH=240 /DNA_ID=CAMNT_0006870433 /DNA_START=82 /DNA_END=804 /DNA_ORIENTATION=-